MRSGRCSSRRSRGFSRRAPRPAPAAPEVPALRDLPRGRQRLGQDDDDREARGPREGRRSQRPARGGRHVPRRRDRAARDLGGPPRAARSSATRRAPIRRRSSSTRSRRRRRAGSQKLLVDTAGPPPHEEEPDGGAREDAPHRGARGARARRTRRCSCSTRRPASTASPRRGASSRRPGATGVVLTKLDGSARGGIVLAIYRELKLPGPLRRRGRRRRRPRSLRPRRLRAGAPRRTMPAPRDLRPGLGRARFALAERGRYSTSPNPMVGAIVVRGRPGRRRGVSPARGRAARRDRGAPARRAARARGADLYLTLEPCVHSGRTPPCAPAVVAVGSRGASSSRRRIRTRSSPGRGIAASARAGIEVVLAPRRLAAPRGRAEREVPDLDRRGPAVRSRQVGRDARRQDRRRPRARAAGSRARRRAAARCFCGRSTTRSSSAPAR